MHFVHLKIPTDKRFKASYFHWQVFSFHSAQFANTDFPLKKLAVNMRWAGTDRWAGSPSRDNLYSQLTWNFSSHMQNKCSHIV